MASNCANSELAKALLTIADAFSTGQSPVTEASHADQRFSSAVTAETTGQPEV